MNDRITELEKRIKILEDAFYYQTEYNKLLYALMLKQSVYTHEMCYPLVLAKRKTSKDAR